MRPCYTLLLAAGLLLPAGTVYAEKPLTDQARAAALVAQLASEEFQVRENAALALDHLGAAALPALQAARQHPDPEVRRHAAEVLRILERRLETLRQFDSPRLRVQYQNVPLVEVLADLSKRSGNPLKLGSSNAEEMGKRTVTLDGDWTFWEAPERVCAAAAVAEPEPEPKSPRTLQIEEGGFRARGRRMMYLDPSRNGRSTEPEAIALLDGKPFSRPTFQAGAAHSHARPPGFLCRGQRRR